MKHYATEKNEVYCRNIFLSSDLFHFSLIEGSLTLNMESSRLKMPNWSCNLILHITIIAVKM